MQTRPTGSLSIRVPGTGSAVVTSSDQTETGEILFFGPFRLIGATRVLVRDGKPVAIGGRALDVLIALTGRAGEVVSGRELIDLVWPGVFVEEANLRVHIAALRKVLGDGKDNVRYVVNVPGRGYTFVAPVRRNGAGGGTASIAAPASTARSPNFPTPLQLLVGRTETVATMSSLLLSRRFVSVIGPGGIGKTTVAVAVGNALRQEFGDDAVCFVDLGSLTDPADVPSAVASALGCFVQGPDHEPYIRAFLADKRILIVLDNCEHVIETAAQLCARLFHAAPSVHLLATSREALRVEGEHVQLLMPLDSPPDETPTAVQALASPAVQLFMERAAASGHHAQLSDTDAPIVAKICRRLDGIALAIELVASRVGTHGIQGTAGLLESGAGLLLPGWRSAVPRHQTLQAMFDWSFRLLSTDEQRVLCRLSVFVGNFTLAAAHAVAGGKIQTVTSAIASLVDKSLMRVVPTSGLTHYRLLDTTRAYAAAKLAEDGQAVAAERGHAGYFTGLLKQGMAKGSAFDGHNVAVHAPHIDNVRKALAWSFSSLDDRSLAIELAALAVPLFLGLSLLDECQQWCRRALCALREADHGTRWELELQGALAMSSMYSRGNSLEVRAGIERGLELSEILQDGRHQLQLLSGLYIFLMRQGEFSGALAAAKRNAAVAKASGGPIENAMTEWMLGGSYHLTGNQAAALRHCKQGSKLASDFRLGRVSFFGHDHHVSGLATLARSLWLCGFPDQGCKVARQGIKTAQSHDHPVSSCISLIYLVPVFHWSGDFRAAQEYTEIVIEQATKYSLAPYRAVGLALKGELMVAHGEASSGVATLRAALKAMDADQYRIVTLPTRRALAEGLAHSGQSDEALATIVEAVARAEQVGEILWLPDLLRAQGEILLMQPRPDLATAERILLRSLDCAHKQSALSWQLKAAIPLARMWKEHGRGKDARSVLEDIYRRFTEGFETRDLVTARRFLEELSSTD